MPANCAEISKVTSGGGNWILRDLGPPEGKAFSRKYSSCIRLWNTAMKNWFRHHLENFISFPLRYSFAGIRCVLTELEANNWKHRSNYTVTLIFSVVLMWILLFRRQSRRMYSRRRRKQDIKLQSMRSAMKTRPTSPIATSFSYIHI